MVQWGKQQSDNTVKWEIIILWAITKFFTIALPLLNVNVFSYLSRNLIGKSGDRFFNK